MNTSSLRSTTIALAVALFTAFSSGCAVTGDGYGYGYDGNVDVGLDYYEPYGGYYGGWGPGYRVGPYREGGDHRPDQGGGHAPPHAYRPAPASHSMPSIPSRGGSGGSRGRGH
jgi:hypothetical protein